MVQWIIIYADFDKINYSSKKETPIFIGLDFEGLPLTQINFMPGWRYLLWQANHIFYIYFYWFQDIFKMDSGFYQILYLLGVSPVIMNKGNQLKLTDVIKGNY